MEDWCFLKTSLLILETTERNSGISRKSLRRLDVAESNVAPLIKRHSSIKLSGLCFKTDCEIM